MGHRAHKACAKPAVYVHHKAKQNRGKAWIGIEKPVWKKPLREKWKPRHLVH